MSYPRLWARVYNTPLLIHPDKARVIEQVFRNHLDGGGQARVQMEEDYPEESEEQRAAREHSRRCVAYAGIELQRADDRPYAITKSGVALVPVIGTLVQRGSWLDAMSGLTSYDMVASLLDRAMSDPLVRAVMLEVDSPGGEVAGAFDVSDRLYAARPKKPLWAAVNEQAYSAGYLLASGAQRVYTPITGGVGSIGAVMLHVDQSKRDAAMGYAYTFIYSGARKVDGNSHEPINKPALKWAQAEVDRTRQLFAAAVAQRRGLSAEAVLGTEAALLTPAQALEGQYIDGVATLLETVSLLERELSQPGSTSGRASAGTSQSFKRESLMKNASPAAIAVLAALGMSAEAVADLPKLEAALSAQAKGHTDEQLHAARAEAKAEGEKAGETKGKEAGRAEGVKAERERISAILGCPEADGRAKLALHLALQTDTDVEAAKKLLAAANKEAAGAQMFAQAMASLGNPKVGADADREATEQPRIDRRAIYAAHRQAGAAAK